VVGLSRYSANIPCSLCSMKVLVICHCCSVTGLFKSGTFAMFLHYGFFLLSGGDMQICEQFPCIYLQTTSLLLYSGVVQRALLRVFVFQISMTSDTMFNGDSLVNSVLQIT
jgi:hypothetical protein